MISIFILILIIVIETFFYFYRKICSRGKPLYLSQDRYQLLEQQWLAHRFDHIKKTWVWHRDAL